MAEEFTAKFKVDISDLKKNITEASKQIKLANATFKAETAGMESWSKDADGLSKKLEQLKTVLSNQKTILSSYEQQLRKQQEAYTENGNRAEQLKAKLQELASQGVEKTSEEYQKYETALRSVLKEQSNNAQAADDLQMQILKQKAAVGQTEAAIRKYSSAQKEQEASSKSLSKTVSDQQSKLSQLKSRYADVVAAEGKNSTSAKNLAKEIKTLSTDLDKNQKELQEASKEADKLDKSYQSAEKGAGGLASKLAGGLRAGAMAAAAGLAAMGAAAIAIGKQALESYAEYEQLVGGVETLFKDSAGIVQNYANNAFKTAGLSANEYMSTVTSFSASLLQSVGNDTEKAAKYADQAITDMSDNANKMGTSMDMIQNAYQGFAKQNYTMLDNLKLGYGGTKTEMERLIADANKVKQANGEMADLSIESFADVVEAIHIIQTEMDITGTTAKEASSTIEGSTRAMKSAWQNLMTGIADDTQDFDGLMNNFVDSLMTMLDNVLPRVKIIITGIGKLMAGLMKDVLPKLVETIPPILKDMLPLLVEAFRSLISGVATALPELLSVFIDIIPQITQSITDLLPQLVSVGVQMIMAIIEGAGQIIPQVVTQIIDMVPKIVQSLIDAIPKLLDGAVQFFMAIVDAIPTIVEKLAQALPQIIDTIISGLDKAIPTLLEGAVRLLEAIVQAIPKIIPPLVKALPKIVTSIVDGLVSQIPTLIQGAVQLLTAIIQAIPVIITDLVKEIPKIVIAIVETLVKNVPTLVKGAVELFMGIIKAIPTIVVEIVKNMPKIIAAIVEGLIGGIGEVFAAAGELFFGIVDRAQAASEAIAKQNEAIYAYADALAETAPQLADYNKLLSDQGNTISDLDSKISETENAITEVLRTALKEQRGLRDEDLESIRNYMDEMNELQQEKMEIYRSQQIAELRKLQLESGEITQETAAQHLANTQAALDEANKATEDAYTARLTTIEQKYKAMGEVGSEAYQEELRQAKEAHDLALQENQEYFNEALMILGEKSSEWVQTDADKWAELNQNMSKFNLDAGASMDDFIRMANGWAGDFRGTKEDFLGSISEMDRKSANGFLNMLATVKENGGQIPPEAEEIARNMLGAFDNLPTDLDQAGKDALLGMIYGMDESIPELRDTSEMTANEIVDTIKKHLGIASPSKVLSEVGDNAVAGLTQGMTKNKDKISQAAKALVNNMITIMKNLINRFKEAGSQMANGVAAGFLNQEGYVKNQVSAMMNRVVSQVRKQMKISSPSKVFAEIGDFMAQGLGVGFVDEMKTVTKNIQNSMPTKVAGNLLGQMSGSGNIGVGGGVVNNSNTNNFTQIINAPKQPSRIELYRQTRNLLDFAGGRI